MAPSTPPELSVDFVPSSPATPRTPHSHRKHAKAITPSSIRKNRPNSSVNSSTSGRGHRRYVSIENNVLLTPEETPARKRYTDLINSSNAGSTARVLFPTASAHGAGAGRSYKHQQSHVANIAANINTGSYSFDSDLEHENENERSDTPCTPKACTTTSTTTTPPGAPHAPDSLHFSDTDNVYNSDLNYDDENSVKMTGRESLKKELHIQHHSLAPTQSAIKDDTPGIWCMFRGKKVFRPLPQDEYIDIVPKRLFPEARKSDLSDSEDDTDVEEESKVSSRDFFVYKRPICKFTKGSSF